MTTQTFILIGRSGCGKGTQGKLLTEYLKKQSPDKGVLYIQSGGELRTFIEGQSHTQKLAHEIYKHGGLQPEFLMVYMWVNVLVNKFTGNENIIIDGTPRKYHEAGVLNSVFDFYNIPRAHVIYINVSKESSIQRLMARGRVDDTREEIEARLAWFDTEVIPTIEYYRTNPVYKFTEVNGDQALDKVFEDITKSLATPV